MPHTSSGYLGDAFSLPAAKRSPAITTAGCESNKQDYRFILFYFILFYPNHRRYVVKLACRRGSNSSANVGFEPFASIAFRNASREALSRVAWLCSSSPAHEMSKKRLSDIAKKKEHIHVVSNRKHKHDMHLLLATRTSQRVYLSHHLRRSPRWFSGLGS